MRSRIMSAALEEMNEHGVRFTMSHLAARLAISKRTLYEHFKSKEVLIESIVDAIIADLQVQRLAIVTDHGLELKEKLVRMLGVRSRVFADVDDKVKLELCVQYPGLWKKARQSQEEQWTLLEGVLQEGIDAGCFRPIFVPAVKKIVQGAVHEVGDYAFLLKHRTSFHEMIGHIMDILIYGIMAPEKHG